MVLTDLRGNRSVASLAKIFSIELRVDYVVLLGNTVSPSIIKDLASSGLRIIGISGYLDDASVIDALKKHGVYGDSKILDLDGLTVFLLGLAFEESLVRAKDRYKDSILLTYYPGFKHRCCCNGYVESVDELVFAMNPRIVVTGRCPYPCFNGYTVSPGYGYLGYTLLIEYTSNIDLKFINLWDTAYHKLFIHKLV